MTILNKLFSVRTIAKSAILTTFMGLGLMVTEHSYAQSTPCDPDYMRALEARAWLEMNREITQNQNLIAKPDSVLEYSCFDKFLDEAATGDWSDRMFSETTRWGSISGFTPTTTNDALEQVVGMAYSVYINTNFNHDYLGDRAVGLDYERPATSAVDEGAYTCGEMYEIWDTAKCMNFFGLGNRGGDPNLDGFIDFDWLSSDDPRNLPTSMGTCPTPALYGDAIATAFNDGGGSGARSSARYVVTDESDFSGGNYEVDNVVTHLDFIMEVGHPLAGSCQTVHTGIQVDRVNIPAYEDGICPNPGCYYDRSSEACTN